MLTDWGAACDRAEGVRAGCDLEMPGGVRHNRRAILRAVENGALTPEELDRAAERVLALADACGNPPPLSDGDREDPFELACAVAKDSAVLLKNDGVLPLTGQERLLVVGELFERMRFQGAGSSLVNPTAVVTPKEAFDRRGVRYAYARGYRCSGGHHPGAGGGGPPGGGEGGYRAFFRRADRLGGKRRIRPGRICGYRRNRPLCWRG